MRAVRCAILIFAIALGFAGLALTFGILTGEPEFYVIAVWLLVFLLVGSCVFLIRGYQRVVSRIGVANERLSYLQYLQERRYEQLRRRSDHLTDSFGTLNETIQKVQMPPKTPHGFSSNSQVLDDLESLNARLQRAERRILGKLENEHFKKAQQEQDMSPNAVDNEQP